MGIADNLKRTFSGKDEEEDDDGILTQMSSATTLSWSTRIKGFIACFAIGVVCSLLGSFLLLVSPTAFAILYSLGTITSLASTMFLMGPLKQLKRMVDPTRIICTLVLLVCIVLTILAAVVWNIIPLAIVFCIIQFLALAWYSISYIPFASQQAFCTTVYNMYQRSSYLFVTSVLVVLFLFHSIIMHYSATISTLIQLLAMYLQSELSE